MKQVFKKCNKVKLYLYVILLTEKSHCCRNIYYLCIVNVYVCV